MTKTKTKKAKQKQKQKKGICRVCCGYCTYTMINETTTSTDQAG